MKDKVVLALATVLLWFGSSGQAHAWKPQPPFTCYSNGSCGIPIGEISANPQTVTLASSTATGSTTLKWYWDFYYGGPTFQLACIYVRVNDAAHYSKMTCEWPGNTNYYTVPWIQAGNMYTFVLAPFGADTVSVWDMVLLANKDGKNKVDVIGVIGAPPPSDGGGDGGDYPDPNPCSSKLYNCEIP